MASPYSPTAQLYPFVQASSHTITHVVGTEPRVNIAESCSYAVLDCARSKHDQWLQSTPSQRASLEPAYILGERKHIPEAQNAVESALRTELLDAIPRSIADACMRHGYCTAELIVWYVMKQLILPPDINEVTMQKEILTPPKEPPATLDQGCAWLEEMQHRLNLCTKQNVHPRTNVAFVNDTLSGITQYYHTVGNIWDSLYGKHQLRESNVTLDRVYAMLAEFLIELRLREEQDKIAQIVTGSSSTVKHSMYDEYINASKGKVPTKGKGKQESGWSYEDDEWHDHQWESEVYEASKGKKGKGKGSKCKGKSKGKNAPRSITPRPTQSSPFERRLVPTQIQTRSTLLHDK